MQMNKWVFLFLCCWNILMGLSVVPGCLSRQEDLHVMSLPICQMLEWLWHCSLPLATHKCTPFTSSIFFSFHKAKLTKEKRWSSSCAMAWIQLVVPYRVDWFNCWMVSQHLSKFRLFSEPTLVGNISSIQANVFWLVGIKAFHPTMCIVIHQKATPYEGIYISTFLKQPFVLRDSFFC